MSFDSKAVGLGSPFVPSTLPKEEKGVLHKAHGAADSKHTASASDHKVTTVSTTRTPFSTGGKGDSCVSTAAIVSGIVLVIIAGLFVAGIFGKGTPDANPQFYAVPIGTTGVVAIMLGCVCKTSKPDKNFNSQQLKGPDVEADDDNMKKAKAASLATLPGATLTLEDGKVRKPPEAKRGVAAPISATEGNGILGLGGTAAPSSDVKDSSPAKKPETKGA